LKGERFNNEKEVRTKEKKERKYLETSEKIMNNEWKIF